MKYFTYELIAASNDWIEQDKRDFHRATKRMETAVRQYHQELESLKTRITQPAWKFFRYGVEDKGLHDARLLSFRIGDGLDYEPDGRAPFRLNTQRTSVALEFLNYEQDLHYVFQLRGIDSVSCNLFADDSYAKSIGDLYIYEITGADKDNLRLGFLFASGASSVAEFKRLVFRMKRLQRRYEIGEMYD